MKTLSNPYLATLLLSMTAKAALADRLADPTRPADARPNTTDQSLNSVRVEAILQADGRCKCGTSCSPRTSHETRATI